MIKVAITGTIASGKSLVEKIFEQEGAITLDTDKVTHELLVNNKKVLEFFGTTDRKKLAEIVFSDKQKLKQLENIIHPEVKRIVGEFFEKNKAYEILAVSVPLLYESGMETMFDFVIMVTCNENIALQRLISKRNMTEEDALKRIKSRNISEKGDFIIENNNSLENLEIKVKNIIKKIKGIKT